jgi:hypothetical protein
MEMPENHLKEESKQLLEKILHQTYNVDNVVPFEELLEMIGYEKSCKECNLEEAAQRVIRLLHNEANSHLQ